MVYLNDRQRKIRIGKTALRRFKLLLSSFFPLSFRYLKLRIQLADAGTDSIVMRICQSYIQALPLDLVNYLLDWLFLFGQIFFFNNGLDDLFDIAVNTIATFVFSVLFE